MSAANQRFTASVTAQIDDNSSDAYVSLRAGGAEAEAVLNDLLGRMALIEEPADAPGADAQLRELRAALPRRPLGLNEGLRLAERQAGLLRWQLGRTGSAALPTATVATLPFLTVDRRPNLAKSALVTQTDAGWVIVLNADEPLVRQRFSLCHEVKHILDDDFARRLPDGLYPAYGGHSAEDQAERVCDHFAATLLMPKVLVRRDWTSGLQDLSRLARRYQVSKPAMEIRLRALGLLAPTQRCGHGRLGAASSLTSA